MKEKPPTIEIPYVNADPISGSIPWQEKCLMCGSIHGNGLPCPRLNPTSEAAP